MPPIYEPDDMFIDDRQLSNVEETAFPAIPPIYWALLRLPLTLILWIVALFTTPNRPE
jgi:hypothetical protein